MAEEDWHFILVVVVRSQRQIRQAGLISVHAERSASIRHRRRIPPPNAYITALVAILIEEIAPVREWDFRSLKQDLGSLIGSRSALAGYGQSFVGEPVGRVQAGGESGLGGGVPTSVDYAQSRKVQPDG